MKNAVKAIKSMWTGLFGKNRVEEKPNYNLNHTFPSEPVVEKSPSSGESERNGKEREKYEFLMEMRGWNGIMRGIDPSNPSRSDFPYLKEEDINSELGDDELIEISFRRAREALQDYLSNLSKINRKKVLREFGKTPEELAEMYRSWRLERMATRPASYLGRGYVHAEKYLEEIRKA